MYTAFVLSDESRNLLLNNFRDKIPFNWHIIAHHMTINLGSPENGPAKNLIDTEGEAFVLMFGKNDKAVAVKLESNIPSQNNIKHITLAINRACGGKPKDSNHIVNWESAPLILLKGRIQVCF
jgi:hypothetical protein